MNERVLSEGEGGGRRIREGEGEGGGRREKKEAKGAESQLKKLKRDWFNLV